MINRLTKRVLEQFLGVELERYGDTVALINPERRGDAWFSYQSTLKSLFSERDITQVIDVGANTGEFAKGLRSFYHGSIHSFEPVSTTYAALAAQAKDDPFWQVHQTALGNETSNRPIHVSTSSDFNSFLTTNKFCIERFGERANPTDSEQVAIRRLEDVLETLSPHPAQERIFLKLDTQGYDLEVFRGLGEARNQVIALQSEVSLIPLYDHMPHWTESLMEFERAGFGVVGLFPISSDAGRVIEFDCLLARARTGRYLVSPSFCPSSRTRIAAFARSRATVARGSALAEPSYRVNPIRVQFVVCRRRVRGGSGTVQSRSIWCGHAAVEVEELREEESPANAQVIVVRIQDVFTDTV